MRIWIFDKEVKPLRFHTFLSIKNVTLPYGHARALVT